MKRTFFLVLFFCLSSLWAQGHDPNNYPRLANYYLSHIYPAQNDSMITHLAKYDLLVLDMELGQINPALISGIRAINPEEVILAYISIGEITTHNPSLLTYPLRHDLKSGIADNWFMKTATGDTVSVWPYTVMLNGTIQCPEVNGLTWNGYLGNFIDQRVLSNTLWDGVFLDLCLANYIPDDELYDCNNDGVPDEPNWLNQQLQLGVHSLLNSLRNNNPSKLIIGNPGFAYGDHLNGGMFEEYDEDNPTFGFGMTWQNFMGTYHELQSGFQSPLYNMIQATGTSSDYQQMRYTLTTALLGDAYYGLDLGPTDHSDLWWFDEYSVDLGEPLEDYLEEGSNQLINGNFNNGTNGWELEVHWPATTSLSINPGSGNPYAEVNIITPFPNPSNHNYYEIALKQANNSSMNMIPGQTYMVRLRAKASIPRQILMVILHEDGHNYPWIIDPVTIDLNTSWQEYEFVVTANNAIVYPANQIRFTFHLAQAGGILSFDDISIRQLNAGFPATREFDNGLVICNPGNAPITVPLSETYYRIAGTQDPVVNNGNSCTQVTVPAKDGRILLKSRPKISLISAEQLSFPSVWVGTSSPQQVVSIKNTGTSPLILSSIQFENVAANFCYSDISFPCLIAVNQTCCFSVSFSPQSDGSIHDTMFIMNNSVNNSALPVILSGTAQYPQPLEPQNLVITMQGTNAHITWDAVTLSIYNTPFIPDCYLVFYNGSEDIGGAYYFHGITTSCAYTHEHVASHAQHMFYRVYAFKASSRNEMYVIMNAEPGIKETEFFSLISGQ